MCTALSLASNEGNNFFGRNMDIECYFNQQVMIVPEGYKYVNKVTGQLVTNKKAYIGMGTIIDNHPAMAEAMNENGLACAGLNFVGYAHYEKEPAKDKNNIAPYDFIQWVVSGYDTVQEVKAAIKDIELVEVPIMEGIKVANLHWMITDKTGETIVVEKTIEGIRVYDNTVGVMTNNPTFDWQITNLNEYINLSQNQPEDTMWSEQKLKALGVGAGTRGIPGDFGSVSRFIRMAYIRAKSPKINNNIEAITQFFHMLDYAKMIRGGVITRDGLEDVTLYSSCMDQENAIYYYKTYKNSRISGISMRNEKLDAEDIKVFPYQDEQDIQYQN